MTDILEEDLDDIEIDPIDQEELDQLHRSCIETVTADSESQITVSAALLFDILEELQEYRHTDRMNSQHMSHCNIYPYEDSCKYGEQDTCPALLRRIDIDQLAQAIYSIQGGVTTTDGTWNSDIIREVFIQQAIAILKILDRHDY